MGESIYHGRLKQVRLDSDGHTVSPAAVYIEVHRLCGDGSLYYSVV